MNKLCAAICILIFMVSCNGKSKTDLEALNLKYKVKSIKEYYSSVNEDKEFKSEEGVSMLVDSNEEILSKETMVLFNKKGMKDTIILSSSLSTYIDLFEYEDNRLVFRKSFDSILLYSHYKYIYNNSNKLVIIELRDASNTLLEETKIEYSENKESHRKFYPSENFFYYIEKVKDETGNILELTSLASDRKQIDRQVNVYNKNLLTESVLYNENNVEFQRSTYVYDSLNNEIEFLVIEMSSNDTIVKYNYQYQYDHKGNWIKQSTYINNNLSLHTSRELSYY